MISKGKSGRLLRLRPTVVYQLAGAALLRHTKRPVKARFASAGTGLRTLDERCRLILPRGIEVSETADFFTVTLPVTLPLKTGY